MDWLFITKIKGTLMMMHLHFILRICLRKGIMSESRSEEGDYDLEMNRALRSAFQLPSRYRECVLFIGTRLLRLLSCR